MTKQLDNEIREIDSDDGEINSFRSLVRFQCQNQSGFFALNFMILRKLSKI